MSNKGWESGQIFITFWLFAWSFSEYLLLVFNPQPFRLLSFAFLILPAMSFFLLKFRQALRGALKKFSQALTPGLLLSILAAGLLLSWLLRQDILAWFREWNPAVLGPVFFPLLGQSLACLLVLVYIKRRSSTWPFLILTTLAEILIFSYVRRAWNILIPLHFAAAFALQYCLRRFSFLRNPLPLYRPREKTIPLPGRPKPGSRLPAAEAWRKRRGLRYAVRERRFGQPAWIIFLIAVSLSLGLSLPVLSPIWFRSVMTFGTILGNPGNGFGQLKNNSIFAWETEHLGGPWQGDDTPLFYVQSPEPLYWRSQVFDYYANGRWLHNDNYSQLHSSPPLNLAVYDNSQTCRVCLLHPLALGTGLLLPPYTSSLLQINAPDVRFDYNAAVDTLLADSVLEAGVQYSVAACDLKYPAETLRKVSTLYNPPISVGMPQSPLLLDDSQAVYQLVLSISAAAPTPYDKLQALCNYLKSNMRYTLTPPPPPDGDFVSDFLLHTHEGYCLHFASALAVMAHMLGYPSRIVMGFTYGHSLPANVANPFPGQDRSTVRVLTREDAHSWAEIYFPGYGWIPFDATPGFSNPEEPFEAGQADVSSASATPAAAPHSANNKDPDLKQKDGFSPSGGARPSWGVKAGLTLSSTALLGILAMLILLFLRRRRWRAMTDRERLAFLYAGILRKAAKQGFKRETNETPAEFLKRLPLREYEALRLWTRFSQLVEEGLYGPGSAQEQLREVQGMRKDIERSAAKGFAQDAENSF